LSVPTYAGVDGGTGEADKRPRRRQAARRPGARAQAAAASGGRFASLISPRLSIAGDLHYISYKGAMR